MQHVADGLRAGRMTGVALLAALTTFVATPEFFGAAALTVGGLAALALGGRMAALDWFARLAAVVMIFGLPAVAIFALAGLFAQALAAAIRRSALLAPPVALAASAIGANALPLISGGSDLSGEVFACLALGAPGAAYVAMAARMHGAARTQELSFVGLGGTLVAIVLGAGLWGVAGAGLAMAGGMLAQPLMRFLAPGAGHGRRRRRALAYAGVLLSMVAGALAMLAVSRAIASSAISGVGGALAAVSVYAIALRVHSPPTARALARLWRRSMTGVAWTNLEHIRVTRSS